MKDNIIIYCGNRCGKDCNCSYCVNRRGLSTSLRKIGYQVSIQFFGCDWNYYYPTKIHFDYAIRYHNKIFGSIMFEANELPNKMKEFAETYFDYIICASKFLKEIWVNSGIETKYLLSSSFGLDTNLFNADEPKHNSYPGKFKFLSVGNWQHSKSSQDRKGFENLIQIFKRLFEHRKDIMLIIKTDKNANENLATDNVKIVKDNLSDKDLSELYKMCAREGAFIHLHRGEGFGKTLLEALCSGCRIGTTGWSGPLSFLNKNNATLFNYKLIDFTMYPENFYSKGILPKTADVEESEVERWMMDVIKEKRTSKNCAKGGEHTWDNVARNLMIEIEKRL